MKKLREQLWQRCNGYCEVCGFPLEKENYALHHRKLRSRGGKDEIANVMALHHKCHNLGTNSVHLNPKWATENGFMVSAYDTPDLIWVSTPNGGKIYLSNDGTVKPVQT